MQSLYFVNYTLNNNNFNFRVKSYDQYRISVDRERLKTIIVQYRDVRTTIGRTANILSQYRTINNNNNNRHYKYSYISNTKHIYDANMRYATIII